MLEFVGGVLLTLVLLVIWFAWLVRNAPEGYEDETGFHLARDPRTEIQAIALEDLDRDVHRALVEAGFAPLPEYIDRFKEA